jgi:hypothetical protein
MKRHCYMRGWTGRATLACLLPVSVFAQAAEPCRNVRPSFRYTDAVASGGHSTLAVSAQAGCFWEVVSQPEWMKIKSLNRGFGSGSVLFEVLPNRTEGPAPGFMRLVVRDLNSRLSSRLDLPIRAPRSASTLAARAVNPR